MPTPIDVDTAAQPASPLVDSSFMIEVLIEAQAEQDREAYRILAARRAELEDAETLRRVRAL